jgi:uracil-DNA glycosylase
MLLRGLQGQEGTRRLGMLFVYTIITIMLLLRQGASLVLKPLPWHQKQVSSFAGGPRNRFTAMLTAPSFASHSTTRPSSYYTTTTTTRAFTKRSNIVMMPEGPEVRTLVDQLQGGVGRRLVDFFIISGRYTRGPPTGWREFQSTLTNVTTTATTAAVGAEAINGNGHDNAHPEAIDIIQEWNCKGKFIYIILDAGRSSTTAAGGNATDFQRSIWVTLGMTGRFLNEAAHAAANREARWCFQVQNPDADDIAASRRNIYYHDTRNFGTIKFCLSREELAEKLQSLGPDWLAESTTEQDFVNIVAAQKPERNVCKFLMDQSKLAGVGNYILSEGLYRSGIDPFGTLAELSETQQRMLFRELRSVALESYSAQGMTRKQGGQYRNVDGTQGQFEFELQCYSREYCPRGKPVHKETNGPHGRTIWYTDDQLFLPRSQRAAATLTSVSMPKQTTTTSPSSTVSTEGTEKGASELATSLTNVSWKETLSDAMASESFLKLAAFLQEEQASGATIYPPRDEIFNALNLCPFDQVKVVIVGQDPYHGPGQGHGLAFSVRKSVKAPPSLRNVFREASEDVGIEAPEHGNLEHWASQGVLLLNTVLTVRRGEANSHAKHGWEDFTDSVVQELNDQQEGLVFLLWGNPAAKKASGVDTSKHTIIRTSHPSPLGATKTASPFLGSKCFSRTNVALIEMGKDPIDWNIE